jgi:tRNA nucleotidyltransferase/poly(A) polymerase
MARGGNGHPGSGAWLDVSEQELGETIDALFGEPFARAAASVRDRLRSIKGAELFVVGGAIRDIVAGRRPKDLDLMVRMVPEQQVILELERLAGDERLAAYQQLDDAGRQRVLDEAKRHVRERIAEVKADKRQLATVMRHRAQVLDMTLSQFDQFVASVPAEFRTKHLPTLRGRLGREGDQFTVTRYHGAGMTEVEVVLPRADVSTGDGHRDVDARADHTMAVEADMVRRDFTVNAMAWDMQARRLIDPTGGQADLKAGILRTVSEQSFADDRLRMIRGLVLAGRYGLAPDEVCDRQYREQAADIVHVTRPRIHDEMIEKLLPSDDPAYAVRLGERYGLISYALDGLTLDIDALERAQVQTKDPVLRLAALVGRADAEHARERLHELHYENDVTRRIARLLAAGDAPDSAGAEVAAWAERLGSREAALDSVRVAGWLRGDSAAQIDARVERLQTELARPIYRDEIAVTGRDLIAAGFEPGPDMGELLARARDAVHADPSLNDRATLLTLLS